MQYIKGGNNITYTGFKHDDIDYTAGTLRQLSDEQLTLFGITKQEDTNTEPVVTEPQIEIIIESIVEEHIATTLEANKWSSLGSCAAYAIVDTSMFNQEALDLIVFADSVWSYAIGKQNEYLANELEYDEETFKLGLPTYGTT
jgi:hypothetical protein